MLYACFSLLALLGLCLFGTYRLRLPASLAPLAAVTFVMVYFSLAGVMGVLRPAGWLFFALAAAALAVSIKPVRRDPRRLLAPGLLVFCALAVLALLYLGVRQPLFAEWDEFSFWGTAAKLTKLADQLYSVQQGGYYWTPTQYPGLVMLGYFAQFWAPGFAPWPVYWGYNLLFFAVAAALCAPFALRRWRGWVPAAVAGVLVPFVFSVFSGRAIHTVTTYMSSYGDLPAGLLFGGVLVFYFVLAFPPHTGQAVACGAKEKPATGPKHEAPTEKHSSTLWALLPLAALVLIKDNTFPIALVAAGIIAADSLLAAPVPGGKKPLLWRKLAGAAAPFAAVLVPRFIWGRHIAWAITLHRQTGGGNTGLSIGGGVVQALRELFGLAPRSERLASVLALSRDYFWHRKLSLFGTLPVVLLVILVLFALAFWVAGSRNARWRIGAAAGLSAAGFAGYYFAIVIVSYGFLMKDFYGDSLPGYERYLSSYLAGWLLLALGLVCVAAARGAKHRAAARGGVLAIACAAAILFGQMVPPSLSVLGYPEIQFAQLREETRIGAAVVAAVPEGERIFFVSQGDDGGRWFRYSYYLLPRILDYSQNGGRSFWPLEGEQFPGWVPPPDEGSVGHNYFTTEMFEAKIRERGCNYVFVERSDAMFTGYFGVLFSDGLAGPYDMPRLYRRAANGLFEPVPLVL